MNLLDYTNIEKYQNLPFEDYLKIPGYSHSQLKSIKNGVEQEFKVSNKMLIGKLVDKIRMGDDIDIQDENYKIAKDIAEKIRIELGDKLLSSLTSQLSYTSDVIDVETGLSLKLRGRPDWELGKLAVLDLKVTFTPSIKRKSDLISLITYMGYDNQLYHYGRLGCKKSHFLVMYSVSAKQTFIFQRLQDLAEIDCAENYWLNQVREYGIVCS